MKKITKMLIVILSFVVVTVVVISVFAVTNITVNVPLPEWQHTNMINVASNHNKTVEQFFKDRILQEVKDQQFSILVQLWTDATPEQQQAAIKALKTSPEP